MKTLREYIDQLDEISRRDFLKGAGATAGLAAMGGAKGQEAPQQAQVDNYGTKLNRYFRPLISFNTSIVEGNPSCVVEIATDIDKNIIQRKLVKPSTSPEWDEAVMKAINGTNKLPQRDSGDPRAEHFTMTFTAKGKATNEEELDEASDDAVKRIEQLVKYK